MSELAFEDLELVYEKMAVAIDQAGPQQERLFLAKLALALAQACGDRAVVENCIKMALQNIEKEA
jgi:transcriptional regulator NrdR family protein